MMGQMCLIQAAVTGQDAVVTRGAGFSTHQQRTRRVKKIVSFVYQSITVFIASVRKPETTVRKHVSVCSYVA